MVRRLVGVGLIAGALLSAAVCEAHEPGGDAPERALELRWDAPAGCPDASYLSAEVARLTLAAREPRVSVDAKAWRDDEGRWRIALVTLLATERGERIVDADTCALAADAAAVVLALMIDPEGMKERAAEPPPPPAAPALPDASSGARAEERVSLAVVGTLDSASLPKVAYGVGAIAGLRLVPWRDRPGAARLRAELGLTILPEQRARSADNGTRGADLGLVVGSARAVLAYGDTVDLGLFAGIELGSTSGRGYGVATPRSSSAFWDAALLGAVGRFPAHGAVALRGSVELAVPLRRAEFDVAGEVVHRAASAIARGTLAAEVRF